MKKLRRLHLLGMTLCAMFFTVVTGCGQTTAVSQPTHLTTNISDSANTTNSTANSQSQSPAPSSSTNTTSSPPASTKKPVIKKKPAPKPVLVKLGNKTSYASYLNESLSLLGYLPVQFIPAHGVTIKQAEALLAKHKQPIPGTYKWRDKAAASALSSSWKPLKDTVVTQGALMRFQLNHHLVVDGIAGSHVWTELQSDLAHGVVNHEPYVFVTVDEHPTEVLKVWQGGKIVFQTAANTGISQSPTSIGTWPIYLRYVSQEMKGTDPWGNSYDDPGVPYVSYFHGGEAIHGFVRGSYGSPQSLGCVEIPVSTAKTVFNLINYGTLVTVRK